MASQCGSGLLEMGLEPCGVGLGSLDVSLWSTKMVLKPSEVGLESPGVLSGDARAESQGPLR